MPPISSQNNVFYTLLSSATSDPKSTVITKHAQQNSQEEDIRISRGNNEIDNIPIDPRLLAESNQLGNIVAGGEVINIIQTTENAIFDAIYNLFAGFDELIILPVDFVRRFLTINIITSQLFVQSLRASKRPEQRFEGNSRDRLSFYVYRYFNLEFGCSYQSPHRENIREYKYICKIISHEALSALRRIKEFQYLKE